MKPNLIPVLLCLFILACQSPQQQNNSNQKASSINKTDSTNKEYLDWDSVKLNNTVPMVSDYKVALGGWEI